MAKTKSKLNEASGAVIEENILKQDPEMIEPTGFHPGGLAMATVIPEMRKVVFLNGRDPGVALHFHYHSKTHPLKQYTLYHGFEHELPLEVIEHLEGCGEAQYDYRRNAQGLPEHFIKGYKYIFQFRNPPKKAA